MPGLFFSYRLCAKGLAAAALTLTLCPGLAPAQAEHDRHPPEPLHVLPGLAGDYFQFESETVGRPFQVFVRLPEHYSSEPDTRYPVVYVLDGDSLFPIVAPNHLFLHYDENLPEAVIVGIGYGSFDPGINRRGYDFSAPAPDAGPDQGGAPAFLEFLKAELLPDVEGRYRIDPRKRILFGQSRSGYLVLYSAFTDPDLFWGRIASNPSFDPGRERFFKAAGPGKRDDLGLVVTSGSRDYPKLREAALEWFEAWADRPDAPWAVHAVTVEGGTHAAYSATSYRIGMLWLFDRE
jgi:predicted alpha/beta superfamily hydrolase